MTGNVAEWCLNEHDHPQRTCLSGTAHRVVRGGSWSHVQVFARTSYRDGLGPDGRFDLLGLRVVRSSPSFS
jgi:formylglycine-generating enzyme required for sulfatase activity